MFGTHDLALFIAAGLLLNITPGPDTFLIMSRSASQGWRAGSIAGLGICSGVFVHIGAAAFGLSALLAYRRVFLQGFLTNVLNPKVGLFFLAFVPQFIDADAPDKAIAFLFLGCVFNLNGLLWTQGVAVFTAAAAQRVRLPAAVTAWLNRAIGALFVSFGVRLALDK